MARIVKRRSRRKRKPSIPTTRISAVVVNREGEILLVKHRKGSKHYWVLPGGRLEYGETFEECAVREVKEETGLDVEVVRFVYLSEAISPDKSRHIVNVFVKAEVTGGTLKLGDEPVLAGAKFVTTGELSELTLFPPVGKEVLDCLSEGVKDGIRYLGNIWV